LLVLIIAFFAANFNTVHVTVAQPIHDIAITSVTPSTASVIVGEPVNTTVVVENQGTAAEDFTVALHFDTSLIENKSVTNLAAGATASLFFIWNTTNVKAEIDATAEKEISYPIEAEASIVTGETDTQDNALTSPTTVVVKTSYIAIIPQRTVNLTITSGMDYTVAVHTDYYGTDVWSWQFSLSYNQILLEGIEVRNGDLITAAKNPSATFLPGTFNNTIGELSLTSAFISLEGPPPYTTAGPGTLAYVTFRVKGLGESNITLYETGEKATRLFGYDEAKGGAYTIIDDGVYFPSLYHIVGGYFRNTATQIVHDITVISITPSSTSMTVGETIDITVIVKNNGTVEETFDVTVYYDYDERFQGQNIIATVAVASLEADANRTLPFTWNTTNVQAGEHKLAAVVTGVPGEVNKANNELESVTVTVKAKETRPLPITEILIGTVLVIAVIAAIILVRSRRKKRILEEI
jgi:hypothetical protein